jgi:hypothetical protein
MNRKKLWLLLAALLYAVLLLWALSHNQVRIQPGDAPRHIGHTLDSLTKTEKP